MKVTANCYPNDKRRYITYTKLGTSLIVVVIVKRSGGKIKCKKIKIERPFLSEKVKERKDKQCLSQSAVSKLVKPTTSLTHYFKNARTLDVSNFAFYFLFLVK